MFLKNTTFDSYKTTEKLKNIIQHSYYNYRDLNLNQFFLLDFEKLKRYVNK